MKRILVLIRHGQSTYNLENRFTGWKDVTLTQKGIDEALLAGQLLKNNNLNFDFAYTSMLKRAQDTLTLILKSMNKKISIIKDISLNERDYGDLVGQNKADAAKQFGEDQVQIWRRSYDISPPGGESLKMTCDRTIPYFKNIILEKVICGNNILLSAHGNSIRAIVKYLFNYDAKTILKTEVGWCEPWYFEFDKEGLITKFKLLIKNKNLSNSNIPIIPTFKHKRV